VPEPLRAKFVLLEDELVYYVYGSEIAPGTGTPHFQCFISFRKEKTFAAVKKLFPTAHIEGI